MKMKYLFCKHWYEVLYKPIVFVFAYIVVGILFVNFFMHVFGVDPNAFYGLAWYGIYFTPVVFVGCLYTYVRFLLKKDEK